MIRSIRPLVSVIATTYNRGEKIRDTVASVLSQSVSDLELLIVSDGSDDDTHDHVVAMAALDDRISLHINDHSGIPAVAMNTGLSLARGQYIAYIDHDDIWTSDHLRLLVAEAESGADLAASGSVWVSPRGKVISQRPSASLFWHPDIQVINPVFENSQALHRAELIAEVGGWSEGAYGLEDWDMWLRMSDAGARVRTVVERTVQETISPRNLHRRLQRRFGFELIRCFDQRSARAGLRAMAQAATELHRVHNADSQSWHLELAADERFVFPTGFASSRAAAVGSLPEALLESRRADAGLKDSTQLWIKSAGDGASVICGIDCMSLSHAQRFLMTLRRAQPGYFSTLAEVVSEFGSVPTDPLIIDEG